MAAECYQTNQKGQSGADAQAEVLPGEIPNHQDSPVYPNDFLYHRQRRIEKRELGVKKKI